MELSNLKEAKYAADSLKYKKTTEQIASANAKTDFDNYQKVQRIVDKVIIDTVEDLQKDLTLLPDRQKSHHVIDHLSGVHIPKDRKGSLGIKLPSLTTGKMKRLKELTTPEKVGKHERVASHSISIGTMGTLGSSVLSSETSKEKIISGFFRKEKKQKHKVDKEKEQIRKDCVEHFMKRHVKVKSISDQYLFNLTQHNVNSYDPYSCRDSESSFYQQKSRTNKQQGMKNFYGPESARMIGSSYNGGDFSPSIEAPTCLNKGSMSVRMLDKNSPRKEKTKAKSLSKIKLEKIGRNEDGILNSKNDLLMQEGGLGKALGLKDQFIFEGMGLLTLHTGYNHATKPVMDYMPKSFNMNIKSLKKEDVDYVQKRTGVNLRHCLYDRTIAEKDVLRFEYSDLQNLL